MRQETINKALELLTYKNDKVVFIYQDGHKEVKRLFAKTEGEKKVLCEYRKGSRRHGFYLTDRETAGIIDVQPVSKKTDKELWLHGMLKAKRFMEASGLNKDLLADVNTALAIGYDKLQQAHIIDNARIEGCSYDEAKAISKEKIKELDERFLTPTGHINTTILWHLSYLPKIKKMYFGARSESILKELIEAIKNKQAYHASAVVNYDVSIEYNPELSKGWYSEEYRNCGNGHYYVMLNETHALFIEDD